MKQQFKWLVNNRKNRPSIDKNQLDYTQFDRIADFAGWAILLLLVVYTLLALFVILPGDALISTHFDSKGIIDDYSGKYSLVILPIIVLAICIFKSSRNYNHWSTPIKITEENKIVQYSLLSRMIRVETITFGIGAFLLQIATVDTALKQSDHISIFILPIFLLLIFCPIIYFYIKMIIANRQS